MHSPDSTTERNTVLRLTTREKYAPRACDLCKKRKSKCDGNQPCHRCLRAGKACLYGAIQDPPKRKRRVLGTPGHTATPFTRRTPSAIIPSTGNWNSSNPISVAPSNGDGWDVASQDEADEEAGDASGLSFVRRVYRHLTSFISLDTFPPSLYSENEQEAPWTDYMPSFFVPPRDRADEYIECYFSSSNVTYRYISKRVVGNLVEKFYASDPTLLQDHSSVAMLLLVMALGCIWLSCRKGNSFEAAKADSIQIQRAALRSLHIGASKFPPTLPTIQSYVLNCSLNLAMARYDSAWISLGTAIRLGQMVNLQSQNRSASSTMDRSRSLLFWSMFMLDRYLSLVLGRPTALHEEDITQPYPDQVTHSQDDSDEDGFSLLPGMVAHAKLTRVMGHINKRLYPRHVKLDRESRDAAVADLVQEIEAWKAETPPFFVPGLTPTKDVEDPFHIIPEIYIRQQKSIQAAFYYTELLLYRGYLLEEALYRIASLSKGEAATAGPFSQGARKCLDAALSMAGLAGAIQEDKMYNPVYWGVSYFVFCSITVIMVYLTLWQDSNEDGEIKQVVDNAMNGHKKLCQSSDSKSREILEASQATANRVSATLWHGAARRASNSISHSSEMYNEQFSLLDEAFLQGLSEYSTFGTGAELDFVMNAGLDKLT